MTLWICSHCEAFDSALAHVRPHGSEAEEALDLLVACG
jgi:hypothetical protein